VAILLVIFWHYFRPSWLPAWSGVDLFFVLSGYLITGNLLASEGQPGYFTGFYRNRALRILPLYFTILIAFLLAIRLLVRAENMPGFSFYMDHWKSFFLFPQNWNFAFHGEPQNLVMAPTWSLAIEEQFYLAWPLTLYLIRNPDRRIRLFITLIVLVPLSRTVGYLFISSNTDLYYFGTFFRMDALILGALLCQIHQSRIGIPRPLLAWGLPTLTLLLIMGCILGKDVTGTCPFFETVGYTLVAIWYAMLLHISVNFPGTRLARTLSRPFLRYCGKISFGLYLIHYPLLFVAGFRSYFWAIGRWPDKSALIHTCIISICVLVSFIISKFSYRYFESFFLRLKK